MTTRKAKTKENWLFHEDYFEDERAHLPHSVQNEVANRLANSKRRPVSDLKEKNPKIEVSLNNACLTYKNKTTRAKARYVERKTERQQPQRAEEPVKQSDHSEFLEWFATLKK
jgi:hypothetical protein